MLWLNWSELHKWGSGQLKINKKRMGMGDENETMENTSMDCVGGSASGYIVYRLHIMEKNAGNWSFLYNSNIGNPKKEG